MLVQGDMKKSMSSHIKMRKGPQVRVFFKSQIPVGVLTVPGGGTNEHGKAY